jgi:hypothetical protein
MRFPAEGENLPGRTAAVITTPDAAKPAGMT